MRLRGHDRTPTSGKRAGPVLIYLRVRCVLYSVDVEDKEIRYQG